MRKICYRTTVSMTLNAFVLDSAKYLYENEKYDITFICDNDEEFAKHLPEYIRYIPVNMKRGISLSGISATIELLKIFKREKFDLVQYSTPNASLYASIAAKLSKIPIRLYCQWGIAYVGFAGIKRKIFKCIEKLVCNFSTHIEPDSKGNLKFSCDEGLYKNNKASVIWNGSAAGVNLKKFDIKNKNIWAREIRKRHNINDKKFVIGFIGRITGDKGINELLSAFKQILAENDNVSLLLIGGVEKAKSVEEGLYNWSRLCEDVIYCGFSTEVEKYLATMDVFVLPSYREGFGSVVIEAEAMGVPVIVTDIPGPTEAIIKDKTGLVVKKSNSEELIKALATIYSDIVLREKMGDEAYNFAKSHFEQEQFFRNILQDRNKLLHLGEQNG